MDSTCISEKAPPSEAIILRADLGGFFQFLSQPDVQQYVWDYICYVADCVETIIGGGKAYWIKPKPTYQALPDPIFVRFLGDGGLYIWGADQFDEIDPIKLPNRVRSLTRNFERVNAFCSSKLPGIWLPRQLRISLSRGSVIGGVPDKAKLIFTHSKDKEYLGLVIGIGEKLQSYCRDLSFIASERLGVSKSVLKKHHYVRAFATVLPGRDRHPVFVDQIEWEHLDSAKKDEYFSSH